jgi:hypothetical protein
MAKKESLWWRIKDAPIGRPVLVWIPPARFPGGVARMEVAVAREIDARSGILVNRFADPCRWTNLPRAPFQKTGMTPKA